MDAIRGRDVGESGQQLAKPSRGDDGRKGALYRNCSSRVMLVMAEEPNMFEMGAMLQGHDVGGLGRG
jgi:hypothetical protein